MYKRQDICLAPYKVKWLGFPGVGISSDTYPYIKIHDTTNDHNHDHNNHDHNNNDHNNNAIERKDCIIGGFGCTLVNKSAYNQKMEYGKIVFGRKIVHGEDIGFFLNCFKAGLKCEYLTNFEQPHYI